jgi:hypothetical protein
MYSLKNYHYFFENKFNFQNKNGNNILLELIKFNNINKETLNFCLMHNININESNNYEKNALMMLIKKNKFIDYYDLILSLIDNGIDLNAIDVFGNTALHYLTRYKNHINDEKNIFLVKYLISNGAKINIKNKNGELPIIINKINKNIYVKKYFFSEFYNDYEKYLSNDYIKNFCNHHKLAKNYSFNNHTDSLSANPICEIITYNFKMSCGISNNTFSKSINIKKYPNKIIVEKYKDQLFMQICDSNYMKKIINKTNKKNVFICVHIYKNVSVLEQRHITFIHINKINNSCEYVNVNGNNDDLDIAIEKIFNKYFTEIGYKYIFQKKWNKNNLCINFGTKLEIGFCKTLSIIIIECIKNYNMNVYDIFWNFINLEKKQKYKMINMFNSYLLSN